MLNRRTSRTVDAFQPFYQESLTAIDGVEIQNNINDFIMLLDRWSERNRNKLT